MLNKVEKIATFYKARVSLRVPENMTKCSLLQVYNTLKKEIRKSPRSQQQHPLFYGILAKDRPKGSY